MPKEQQGDKKQGCQALEQATQVSGAVIRSAGV